MSTSQPRTFRAPSSLAPAGLRLVSVEQVDGAAPFFVGDLLTPQPAATALAALGQVVSSSYQITTAQLAAIADPVVTLGDGVLRFEGFSQCCGVYARVDLLPDALRASDARHGTTNVDFGIRLRAALARAKLAGSLGFRVSPDAVEASTDAGQVFEPRVELPDRWLRAFSSAFLIERGLTPVGEVSGPALAAALRLLPRQERTSTPAFLAVERGRAAVVWREPTHGVRLSGAHRLAALTGLLPSADRVVVLRGVGGSTSAFAVHQGPVRLLLVCSADPWKPLSADGSALYAASRAHRLPLARARAALRWQPVLRPGDLDLPDAELTLTALAAEGLLGFDVHDQAWFHRELPWKVERLPTVHPRLRGARRIVDGRHVRLDEDVAWVQGTGVEHRVDLGADPPTCTCTWFAKHRGQQGPCRHVLAAWMVLEEGEPDGRS